MARRPTNAEWDQLHAWFPRLLQSEIWILGEATPRYNCLAWALGYTDRWVWPWGANKPDTSGMTAFLRRYGLVPGSPASRGTYGSSASVGHIARFWVDRPSSKIGAKWLITHSWAHLEGGIYGNFVQSYRVQGVADDEGLDGLDDGDVNEDLAPDVWVEGEPSNVGPLSVEAAAELASRAATVDPDVRERFEAAYRDWRATWLSGDAALDSSGAALTQSEEFKRLAAQLPGALPLVMEKLADPDEHLALLLLFSGGHAELVPSYDEDDPAQVEGQQARARATLLRWLGR